MIEDDGDCDDSTMVCEAMEKLKAEICQEDMKNQMAILIFPWPSYCLFNLKPLFARLNKSYSGTECCNVTRTLGWQKSGNRGVTFAEVEWTLSLCPTIFIIFVD